MSDRWRLALIFCSIATSGVWLDACHGANPPKTSRREMRETATLSADSNVLKRFGSIGEYISEKRWTEAIDVLQEIAQSDGRKLVQAKKGSAGETSLYLNTATRCNVLLTQLPPEGLAVYRKRVDPQVRRWLDHWELSHDEADLQRVVREGYLSSYGDDALLALGETAWDRGDFPLARLYWTQLVPLGQQAQAAKLPTLLRYPDSDLNPAEILAKLILCSIMEGDRNRAATEIERLKQLFPDATGYVAGRSGNLVELLSRTLEESARWIPELADEDVTTFGLNPGRDGRKPATIEIGASKWSHQLPSSRVGPDQPNAMPNRGPLSYHPVTFGDIVLVNSAHSIWAWNLLTGEPAWPSVRGSGEIYPAVPEESIGTPSLPCVGVPFQTMTIADGRLYARMGSSVTNPASDTTNATIETENETLESDLICLDLTAGQGKLVWKLEAQTALKDWRFEGAPLVMGGRAYVAISRRRPQFEFAIVCLEAASGTLLWNRTVVVARGNIEDHQNRVSHLLLSAGAGRLYFSSEAGAIIAVNARDGREEWGVTYESLGPLRPHANQLSYGLTPPMFHDGLVFVAPSDSNFLYCIEADSGRVRWQIRHIDPIRWRHLLGVVPGGEEGRLIISGASLCSIDIATGDMVFGPRTSARPPASEQGFGRGLIAGDQILWPTREAIQVIDAATGTPLEIKHLTTPGAAEIGGNLTIAGGILLVAQPERLVAYCEYSLLKNKLDRLLSERFGPDGRLRADFAAADSATSHGVSTETLYSQKADLDIAQGNIDLAIETMRTGIARLDEASVPVPTLRARLLDLLRRAAHRAIEESNPDRAIERLAEARPLSADPETTVAILMETARAEIARDRPVAAVGVWQQILEDDTLSRANFLSSTGAVAASREIARLIRQWSPAVYVEIERRASQKTSALMTAHDLEGLRTTIAHYPNAEATARAWSYLAREERSAGRYDAALAIIARSLNQTSSPESHAAVLADWADTLEAAGYLRTARGAWKQMAAADLADTEVELKETRIRSGDLARQRLENPVYRSYDSTQTQSRSLNRSWKRDLELTRSAQNLAPEAETAAVVIPINEAPATSLACLVVLRPDPATGRLVHCHCVDRATGQVRWSRAFPDVPQWTAYSGTALMIAAGSSLMAVSLDRGTDQWTVPLTPTIEQSPIRLIHADGLNCRLPESGDRLAKPVPSIQICVRDPWVIAFDPRAGVTAVDTRTGDVAWTITPSGDAGRKLMLRGNLNPQWSCGTHQIAVQALKPAAFWLIDIGPECEPVEQAGDFDPWLQGPVIDEELIVTMNSQRLIDGHLQKAHGDNWQFQGGMSFSHVDPVLWQSGGQLLLTVDGMTLTSIQRSTGKAEWSAGIAHLPLKSPARQVISMGDAAFAASHGLLRRISLKYGDCQWERFLGSTADQWQVAPCGDLIAAWPLVSSETADNKALQPRFVIWCDARTGRILQRLTVRPDERILDVTSDELGSLVTTSHAVIAFSPELESRSELSALR